MVKRGRVLILGERDHAAYESSLAQAHGPVPIATHPTRRAFMSVFTRREILQAGIAGALTVGLAPLSALAQVKGGYALPKLHYSFDALEPYIDKETMQIHYQRHHQAYITNANNLLKSHPDLLAMPVNELLASPLLAKLPEKIHQDVVNNAGGHSNHTIFWEIMGPHKGKSVPKPTGALAKQFTKSFGSFDKFVEEFSSAGIKQFGSGWAWLVLNKKGELEVIKRPNQNSPYMEGLKPLLGCDVWEHAYYLKYQNKRADYIKAWWNVVNWKAVAERADKAMKG
jgi:Fe-Mn family superoxide dismutase